KYGNDTAWMGSAGIGYRSLFKCSSIVGGYLFVDRDVTERKNKFWVLNPGIETLGEFWDARINGYIPVSNRRKFDHSAFGDEIGRGEFVTFKGHQQFDRL